MCNHPNNTCSEVYQSYWWARRNNWPGYWRIRLLCKDLN